MGGAFENKKVSLHWKKRLEPNWSQASDIEACRKLTTGQRKISRCWSLSGSGDCILNHRLLEDGRRKHYDMLFPEQFMSCCPRQESRSDSLSDSIFHLSVTVFFMCPILNFAITSGSSKGHCLKGIYPFSDRHQFKMSAPLLRTLLSTLASLSSW